MDEPLEHALELECSKKLPNQFVAQMRIQVYNNANLETETKSSKLL